MTAKTLLMVYGPNSTDLNRVREQCSALGKQLGIGIEFRQAGDAAELASLIEAGGKEFDALIVNPAGCSTMASPELETCSAAIKSIADLKKPIVEVHPNNIFHHDSEVSAPLQAPQGSKGSVGLVCGLGTQGYLLSIKAVAQRLKG